MRVEFLDPNTNMRFNWGDPFSLSLTRLGDVEVPGIDVLATAMGLATSRTTKISLRVRDEIGALHELAVERTHRSTFHVQEMAVGKINATSPFRVWYNQTPVAGYRATRNGLDLPMHDADFVPYVVVFEGLTVRAKPRVRVCHDVAKEVQETIDAMWGVPPEIDRVEVHVDGFTVSRVHLGGSAFRVKVDNGRVKKSVVRILAE